MALGSHKLGPTEKFGGIDDWNAHIVAVVRSGVDENFHAMRHLPQQLPPRMTQISAQHLVKVLRRPHHVCICNPS